MNKFILTWNIMLTISLTTLIIFKKLVLNINPSTTSIILLIITILFLIYHNKVIRFLRKL
jgi:hypothetical protein